MATIVFDGTASVTASASADQIVFSALPTSVTNVQEVSGNVVIAVGANTLTITGATLASLVAANFITSNVWTGNGLVTTPPDATGNLIGLTTNTSLTFGLGGGGSGVHDSITVGTTVASGNHLIFGGAGFGDTTDGTDIINAGAALDKAAGTYAVYANGGADTVNVLTGASTAGTASVYGGGGDDQISVGSATATVAGQIYGSAGADKLGVTTLGSVSIFGGTGISDTVDGADIIGTQGKGTFAVYGNAGADSITHTSTAAGASLSIYGGNGIDSITVTGAFSTTGQVFGGGDGDSIAVNNEAGGATTIFGGTGISDSTDVADSLKVTGAGTFTIYGNGGNDTVNASALTDGATFSVYGGAGNDEMTVGAAAAGTTGAVFGSQGTDSISVTGATGSNITVYGGTGVSDTTDGADKLVVTGGAGKFTVYGNAGNDSISLGTAADVNTATVNGGGGSDVITVDKTDQAAMDASGAGAITLNGNEQTDTFVFTANAIGSTSDANTKGVAYAVGDFTAGGGGDVLNLSGLGAASAAFTVATTPASVQAGVTAAAAGAAGTVTAFQFGADTYVVVDGDAGVFDATKDTVIKLTGVTATSLAASNFTV